MRARRSRERPALGKRWRRNTGFVTFDLRLGKLEFKPEYCPQYANVLERATIVLLFLFCS